MNKIIEFLCPWIRLRRIERELNAQERAAYGEMYMEYWMNWADNILRETKRPLLIKEVMR